MSDNLVRNIDAARALATVHDVNRPAEMWSGLLRDGRVFVMQIDAGVDQQPIRIVVRWAGQPVRDAVELGTFLRLTDARDVLQFMRARWAETHANQETADRVAWLAP